MKLIKIITAVVMSFGMMLAQPPAQGGNQDGNQGPDPFQQAFMDTIQNGGTTDAAFEAVAALHHRMDVECNDCEMTEEEFQEGKAEAKAAFDAVLADGGTPQEAFHAAMDAGNEGDEDHQEGHGECRVCGLQMNSDDDWRQHCDENWEHCKPQAGDTCGFAGLDGQGEECGYVHTGDSDEDHHHCDHCGVAVNSGEEMHEHMMSEHPDNMENQEGHGECRVCGLQMNSDDDWRQHCDENWEHCKPQAGDTCGFAGLDGQGEECGYVHTGDSDEDHHHCDHCGVAVNSGEEMHEHMMSEHPDNMENQEGHGECRVCGLQMNSDDDWRQHCDENWEHCKPQAGDTCGFAGLDGQGEECGYVHTGDSDEDHHHCDHCGVAVNSGEEMHEHMMSEHPDNMENQEGHGECRVCGLQMNSDDDWRQHCDENWEHCKAQEGDVCGFAGLDGQGEECGYVHTGDSDEDHHHCDHCGVAVNSGEEMHNHLEADHPDRPARDNCEALYRGLDSFINENGDAIAAWATNGDGTPACGQDDDGNN